MTSAAWSRGWDSGRTPRGHRTSRTCSSTEPGARDTRCFHASVLKPPLTGQSPLCPQGSSLTRLCPLLSPSRAQLHPRVPLAGPHTCWACSCLRTFALAEPCVSPRAGLRPMPLHQRCLTWPGQQPPPSLRPSLEPLEEKTSLSLSFIVCLPPESSSPHGEQSVCLTLDQCPAHSRCSIVTCQSNEQAPPNPGVLTDDASQLRATWLQAAREQ